MTTARDLMTVDPVSIRETDTLVVAARTMRDRALFSLPVCAEGQLLTGVITDRDIVVGCVAMGRDPAQVTAGEMARGTPRWIDAGADVGEVLQEMKGHQIRRLPVIEDKRLVGMISEADLAQHLTDEQLAAWVESVYARSALR